MGALVDEMVDGLLARTRRELAGEGEGELPSAQLAVGYEGEIVLEETLGDAAPSTRYVAFSATKALVAATAWRLIADGRLDVSVRVADLVPEFGTNGKEIVTVEQVMLHTSGFPLAPLGPPDWFTREGRLARFARWRLNWEPGTRYEYHATSAHWVLAEIIERLAGVPYADAVHALVTEPLGLPRLLAIPEEDQGDIRPPVKVGTMPTKEQLEAAFGVAIDPAELIGADVTIDALLTIGRPENIALGVPGGGGVMRAADLARFYQALLHDPLGLWPADLLADVTGRVRNNLPDPLGVPAGRSLGLVIAGDDGMAHLRGFGHTTSARAFGHNGAGGQQAWADPESGLSFVWLTDGMDQDLIREQRRDVAVCSLAGRLRSG